MNTNTILKNKNKNKISGLTTAATSFLDKCGGAKSRVWCVIIERNKDKISIGKYNPIKNDDIHLIGESIIEKYSINIETGEKYIIITDLPVSKLITDIVYDLI